MTAAACPACVAGAPMAMEAANGPGQQFSVPGVHCAACIGQIERGLAHLQGVISVRVNLSMKRLTVTGPVAADAVLEATQNLGFEIYPLDSAALKVARDDVGRGLLTRLAVSGFAMMNVMLLSVAVWSGAADATRDLFHLISALIALPVIAYAGQPFFSNAWMALRARRLSMDVPISLAIWLAAGSSLYETLHGGEHAYFDAAVALTFFLLIGRYLDHQTRSAARSAAKELTALEVHTATRIKGDHAEEINVSDLSVGDEVSVPAGARVPVDGTLLSDAALMDRSFLTGESAAMQAAYGDSLRAGEVNLAAPVRIRATAVGEDTTLRRMAALVETAENGRNSYTALADKAASLYAPGVHILSFVAFLGWYLATGDLRHAINIAVAVLIITCPCALGLAVPAVSIAAISRLFSAGFLVKHATALERLAEVDHIVFDKTGTLTRPSIVLPEDFSTSERQIAKALAQASYHPLSRALARALEDTPAAELTDIQEIAGSGVQAMFGDTIVRLGRGGWLGAGFSGLGLRIADAPAHAIEAPEALRTGVTEALAQLDLPAEIMTGDAPAPANALAQRLNLPVTAQATPEDKLARLDALKANGAHTLMIGDGLNDTAALASAHASIAPSAALEASRSAADVIVLRDSFADLPLVLRIARATRDLSKQNFTIATIYNVIAVPFAIAGLATPLVAALAMSASSLTVLLNAQRMRYVR
ncbi:heavy metal translocating P-type ATPase [uncultured Sulfitobacter sp.]|uniref:heavy metal translocating P-type ATPase n=1 Tax=uncultured Sulfitobacter sp. TaxID=191468 RepID=UPI00261DB6A6|nr:heavy metal translocating P-type ATPase [uncultured Sulfitobacter sp.]